MVRNGRPSAHKRGYGSPWRAYCQSFLSKPENKYCACGCGDLSEVVDHIKPHKGDKKLFWDKSNHQGMTKRCHSRKTAMQDGGFGRKVSSKPVVLPGCDAKGMPVDPNHPWNRGSK